MTAKNRKLLAILGSAAVLVVAVALIVVFTGGLPDKPAPEATENGGTVSVGDITGDPVDVPVIDAKPDDPQNIEPPAADPVLDINSGEDVNVNISEFQEDTTPPAPPVVKDESALTNPDAKPTYEDNQPTVNKDNGTPKNGDKKDGKIYIEGFGWIADEGGQAQGGTVGNEGDELTGNKVGNMG